MPVLLLIAGAGILFFSQRRRKSVASTLTAEESAELDRILAGAGKSPESKPSS
jgi:cytochrome c-type biogenesis protein CcmH/NrfF